MLARMPQTLPGLRFNLFTLGRLARREVYGCPRCPERFRAVASRDAHLAHVHEMRWSD